MGLYSKLKERRCLDVVLRGIISVLRKELEIPTILLTMSDDYIAEYKRRAVTKNEPLKFPYAYMKLNSLAGSKDEIGNGFAMRRNGVTSHDVERSSTSKIHTFPVKLELEFHYVDSDPNACLTVAETFAVLSCINGLNFNMRDSHQDHSIRIEVPTDVSIPIQETNSDQAPGACDITVTLIAHVNIGIVNNVSAVNGSGARLNITVQGSPLTESYTIGAE